VVGVRHDLLRAADKPPHAILQVIEAHGVMARVAAGWLQSRPGGKNVPNLQQGQTIKADQRRLLGKFIDGGVADGEDRDSVDAVDAVKRAASAHRMSGSKSPPRTSTTPPSSKTSPSRSRLSFIAGL
jgi:hypothetical protein